MLTRRKPDAAASRIALVAPEPALAERLSRWISVEHEVVTSRLRPEDGASPSQTDVDLIVCAVGSTFQCPALPDCKGVCRQILGNGLVPLLLTGSDAKPPSWAARVLSRGGDQVTPIYPAAPAALQVAVRALIAKRQKNAV